MQIGSISSIAPITSGAATPRVSKPIASAAGSVDADASSAAETTATSASPTSGSAPSSPATPASPRNNPMAAAYSTSIGGKTYSGSVSESGGVYQVAVPNVPGAHASGSSVQAAENNLNMRIDELV